eukprot:109497_1
MKSNIVKLAVLLFALAGQFVVNADADVPKHLADLTASLGKPKLRRSRLRAMLQVRFADSSPEEQYKYYIRTFFRQSKDDGTFVNKEIKYKGPYRPTLGE